MNDELIFADEGNESEKKGDSPQKMEQKLLSPWKIMVVDDDESIHDITKLVLRSYHFEGRGVEFISAYSGKDALELLVEHPDTAVMLLDVVMETDDAGLNAARDIRLKLQNRNVRIILRTGQPGSAPEKDVIMNYDINDYKEKTELTSTKLFTTVTAALRSYRDLKVIERNRAGLKQIINSSASLFELQSLEEFANGALTQLISLVTHGDSALYGYTSGFALSSELSEKCNVMAGTGEFEGLVGKDCMEALPESVRKSIERAEEEKKSGFTDDGYVAFFETINGSENIIFIKDLKPENDMDRELINIFSNNLSVAFDNIHLNKEVIDTQKDVIYTLGEAVDMRSKETANHVKRVGEYSYLLCKLLGMSEDEADTVRTASPLHDVGKIGIPDSILKKPGKLSDEEFDFMKTHAFMGYNILKASKRQMLRTAATIAYHHHENWDGSGYPQRLKGEEIHIHGRIVKFADVFDALSTKRCYKEAWTIDEVKDEVLKFKGLHFDPKLVDLFIENIDKFLEIKAEYPD